MNLSNISLFSCTFTISGTIQYNNIYKKYINCLYVAIFICLLVLISKGFYNLFLTWSTSSYSIKKNCYMNIYIYILWFLNRTKYLHKGNYIALRRVNIVFIQLIVYYNYTCISIVTNPRKTHMTQLYKLVLLSYIQYNP